MLFHHIYACPPAWVEGYGGVLGFLGVVGKVCVSVFLFCSAYGLSHCYDGIDSVVDSLKFVAKRLVKFYTNYWVIFLLFVAMSLCAAWQVETYWLVFASGILWHQYEMPISRSLQRVPRSLQPLLAVALCAGSVWGRCVMPDYLWCIRWDAVITWTLVLLTVVVLRACRPLVQGLHS